MSLSIDLAKGTWFDHEAGKGGGVLDLIYREKGLANGEAIDWLVKELNLSSGSSTTTTTKTSRRIVATYDYTDEKGNLLYQVVRYEPRDFRQRRPDGNGGWLWQTRGLRRVPYHLPELLAADNRTIYIAEGEKDVDNLRALGLAATCNAEGAEKWPEHFRDYFAMTDVVVLPDNDAPGRKHARMVAKNLQSVGAHVRVVELPDLPHKGDVSDWIAAGGTVEKLAELVEQTPLPDDAGLRRGGAVDCGSRERPRLAQGDPRSVGLGC